ncbi:MAG TPA: BON domain-containing protein [Steroidobacteraceae bacterium]|nr:BON domain-containing protein [Steroidobacteraceae bacterium]
MKSDTQLRDDIIAELEWDPSFDSRNIAVAVKNGIATLNGHVTSFAQSWQAQRAAQNVAGVKAVANEIQVNLPGDTQRSDTDIAQACIEALSANVAVPSTVKVTVHNAWINLGGEVFFWYQKKAAEQAVRYLRGIKGISNGIMVKPVVEKNISEKEIRSKIESAFQRHAHQDANAIRVTVKGSEVTLDGRVPTWNERQAAELAAWAAPGVTRVDDRLVISQ